MNIEKFNAITLVTFTLEARRLVEARRYLDQVSRKGDEALESLRGFVEKE